MDNHPIPQDVTNFQFRLIGDMTLKQFGYIAAGVILAWILLASPVFILFKLAFAMSSVLMAVILAFVPIDGRPSDVMIMRFLKALFNPAQFMYQKGNTPAISSPQTTLTPPVQQKQEEKEKKEEKVQLQALEQVATAAVKQQTQPEPVPPSLEPTPEPTPQQVAPQLPPETEKKEALLENQVSVLTEELAEAKQEEKQTSDTAEATAAHQKVSDLENTLQELVNQKEDLEKKLIELQKALAQKNQQVYTPSEASEPKQTEHVKKIPKQMSVGVGAPLVPDVPNLITGVIKDARGNVLPNILIEIKDKDGNPVRAFKTNQLGQFASATPLLNGLYTISFEDPQAKQSFDSVEITVDGQILLPLEIISVDERERLRKELFGK